jgi:L-alanine-DL-glutamate epimerase-like enolase superfamily enzyme
MKVPKKPGIGVTVLEDVIRKLAVEHKEIRSG